MNRFTPAAFAAAFGGLAALAMAPAPAAAFPTQPVTIIVPYTAGGATDLLARRAADLLTPVLGQSVVVENRPGAGATLGTTLAARARPDGHTLYMGQVSSHGIAPAVYDELQYDALGDFTPLRLMMTIPNVMVVNAEFPADDVAGFVEVARERRTTFASSGTGSSIHLSGEMFKSMLDLDMTHVPYRGSGEAVPALLSGDVDVMFDNLPSALPQIQAGGLKALAVTTPERSPSLPDVPTLQETGIDELAGFAAMSWFGLLTQSRVPEDRVAVLQQAIDQIMEDPEMLTFIDNRGGDVGRYSGPDFTAFIESELALWAEVVEAAGVQLDP